MFSQVFFSQQSFHKFENQLRLHDGEEQKRNRPCDAEPEGGIDPCHFNDPYAPYRSPNAPTNSLLPSSFSKPLEMPALFLIPMPLVLENTPNYTVL